MRIFAFAVFAAAVIAVCAQRTEAAPVTIFPVPVKFRIVEGGYLSGTLRAELKENGMIRLVDVNYSRGENAELVRKVVAPTIADWRTFIRACDDAGVWDWQESYVEPRIMDGLQWSVEIVFEDEKGETVRRINSHGSNMFPPGQSIADGKSEQYKALWRALKQLLRFEEFDPETMQIREKG